MNEYHLRFTGGQGENAFYCVNLHKDKTDFVLFKNAEEVKSGNCRRIYNPDNFSSQAILTTFMMWGVTGMNVTVGNGHLTHEQQKDFINV